MLNLRNQKGSVTFLILSSCLFFIASVTGVFMYMQSKQIAVDREYRQMKEIYEGKFDYEGKVEEDVTVTELKSKGKIGTENVRARDGNNTIITVPAGFAITKDSPESAKEGIIITDSIDGDGNSNGNEFVWIPINYNLTVNGTHKIMAQKATGEYEGRDKNNRINYEGVLYNFQTAEQDIVSTQRENFGLGSESCREPDTLIAYDNNSTNLNIIKNILKDQTDKYENINAFKNTMQEDYNEMIESIKKYGGFYVSRYEMGRQDKNPVSKKGEVTTSAISGYNSWYGLYSVAKSYTNSFNSVKSNMIWGSQYDAMLNFALIGSDKAKLNEITNGNHTGMVRKTGETTTDKIINIFDLEGNGFEWTLEAFYKEYRMRRGGSFHTEDTIAPMTRNTATAPDGNDDTYTSRFTLYIN